jgi:hypothetical protein
LILNWLKCRNAFETFSPKRNRDKFEGNVRLARTNT